MASTSRSSTLFLVCGAVAAGAGALYYFRNRNAGTKHEEPKQAEKTEKVIKKKSPSRVLKHALSPEECKKQEQQAADTITRSFSLTEIAANTDPKIAEQNRQIAAQRNKWEEKKTKPITEHGKAKELKEQRLVELLSFAYELTEKRDMNDPVVMEECKKQQQQAADTITRSFSLTEIAADTDPKIAEQNRQIAAQRKKWEEKRKKTTKHGKAKELKE
jgi:hypothetical protein